MKLTFHGVGGAFAGQDQYNSGAYIEDEEGKVLLIDCGSDARHSLTEAGVGVDRVSSVFITHLHADHVGGLEWLAFASYFNPNLGKPTLYVMEDLYQPLMEITQPGLGSLEEIHATLHTYFNVQIVKDGESFAWRELTLTPFHNFHTYDDGVLVPSYGLEITNNYTGLRTLYSGDTTLFSALVLKYDNAHRIFHDCETLPFRSSVHAHYDDLNALPEDVKKKMHLYHYADNGVYTPSQDGFGGFINKGVEFNV